MDSVSEVSNSFALVVEGRRSEVSAKYALVQ